MGPAFSFLFFMVLVAAIAALSIPFLIITFVGLWKRIWWLAGISGFISGGILTAAFAAFCGIVYLFLFPSSQTTDPEEMRRTFSSEFGFPPGRDVVLLNQRIYALADNGALHLKFRASPETFEKIREKFPEEIEFHSFLQDTGGSGFTGWWVKQDGQPKQCFANEKWPGNFGVNFARLCYDPQTGEVYFFSEGID